MTDWLAALQIEQIAGRVTPEWANLFIPAAMFLAFGGCINLMISIYKAATSSASRRRKDRDDQKAMKIEALHSFDP